MKLQNHPKPGQAGLGLSLLLIPSLTSPASAQGCGVNDLGSCITPIALGSASFEFQPLFPADHSPRFVYAFDSEDAADANAQAISAGTTVTVDTKAAFWLEYDTGPNLTASAHQVTEFAVLMGDNITGTPGGGHNGCDGVWGRDCSQNLAAFVKRQIASVLNDPGLYWALREFNLHNVTDVDAGVADPITNLSCPWGVLNNYYVAPAPSLGFFSSEGFFAEENGARTAARPSGNSSSVDITARFANVTAAQQYERVAVGLMSRVPLEGNLASDVGNIQLEMVCVKAAKADDASSDNNPGSATGTASGSSGAKPTGGAASGVKPETGVWGMIMAAMLLMI